MSLLYLTRGYAKLVGATVGFVGFVVTTGSASYGAGPGPIADRKRDVVSVADDANTLLRLKASTVVRLDFDAAAGVPITTTIPLGDDLYTLELEPYSLRSAGFKVTAQLADGSYVNVDPGPVRTLRGRVVGIDGSAVAAALLEDGLQARVVFPNDVTYWVEPIDSRVANAMPGDHVVYRDDAVIPHGGTCIVRPVPAGEEQMQSSDAESAPGGSLAIAELAIDADFEFFQDFGTVSATVAQIESVVNVMDIQYIRDVAIHHEITEIIVRTAEPDPYTSTDPEELLYQFRNHWISSQAGVPRDVAQLFTGKNVDGNVIGIAWVAVVCWTDFGYGVVQSNYTGSFACKTDLSAHELGHNWSAFHCSCSTWTMNSNITCANQFHPSFTIPGIISFRATRSCLDFVEGEPCSTASVPQTAPNASAQNRYLSIVAGDAGRIQAIRVRFVDLPPPFDVWNFATTGRDFFVGTPFQVCENGGNGRCQNPPDCPDCGPAGPLPRKWFWAAPLVCNEVAAAHFTDWTTIDVVHIFHEGLVPQGVYDIQVANLGCSLQEESSYSVPLTMTQAKWGDICSDGPGGACTGVADGNPELVQDVLGLIDKFQNINALQKSMADLVPGDDGDHNGPDFKVTIIGDALFALDAFQGFPYPFVPGDPCAPNR